MPKQFLKAKFQPNWLSQRAVQKKEAIALIFKSPSNPEAESWTYSQLEHCVNDWAERLQALGLKSGDRVGLLLTNHPLYIIIVHALVKCEAIAVFLNIRLTISELHWQIEDSQTKYLFCDEFTQSTANSLEQQIDNLSLVVINSHSQKSPSSNQEKSLLFSSPSGRRPCTHKLSAISLVANDPPQSPLKSGKKKILPPFQGGLGGIYTLKRRQRNLCIQGSSERGSEGLINLENIQGIFYTSGTTGKPKAVPLTYQNHFYSAIASTLNLGINTNDNWLLCMPLFHVGGLAIAWRSVINGTAITLLPKFDEQEVLEAIATEKVTLISLVPTMLNRLLQHPQAENLQQLRGILLGGAPASSELIERCLQLNLPIMPTYGMTETASQVTTLAVNEVKLKQGSSGLPLFGNQIRIVPIDHGLEDLPTSEIGEILVRGASVMTGYLNDNDNKNNVIENGWLHTGDLGYCDRDGYLYVVSRRSDLIISGGENIYPSEIESILLEHPAIIEACVVGISDRDWGESVAAVIVTKVEISLAEVRNFCEQKSLSRYKLPKSIHIWESLPKSASGKLLRQNIRACLDAIAKQ